MAGLLGLRQQHRGACGLAGFQVGVGLDHVFQGIGLVDLDLDMAGGDAIASIFVRLRLSREQPEEGDDTMTEDRIALEAFIEKAPDADFLCEMISFAAERLMALKVDGTLDVADRKLRKKIEWEERCRCAD